MTDACCCDHGHSVTSAHVDMAIDNNSTWSDAFQFGEPDDISWTLEGCSFRMDVQLTYYDKTPELSLTTTDGTIVVDDVIQRVIHLNSPAEAIQAALSPGIYVYDLVMTDANGVRTALMHGAVEVSQGVTYP